jgi:hypothetical protein
VCVCVCVCVCARAYVCAPPVLTAVTVAFTPVLMCCCFSPRSEIVEMFPELREGVLSKLVDRFGDIEATEVYRVALWILGEVRRCTCPLIACRCCTCPLTVL